MSGYMDQRDERWRGDHRREQARAKLGVITRRRRTKKALRIDEKAWFQLEELKKYEEEKARSGNDPDKFGMLTAMDLGAFAGYLITKLNKDFRRDKEERLNR